MPFAPDTTGTSRAVRTAKAVSITGIFSCNRSKAIGRPTRGSWIRAGGLQIPTAGAVFYQENTTPRFRIVGHWEMSAAGDGQVAK